jgi:hypothetical protein
MAQANQTTTKKTVTVTAETTKALKELPTLSARIRYLDSKGMSRGDIQRTLTQHEGREIRYQHVRNVLVTPVKQPKQ